MSIRSNQPIYLHVAEVLRHKIYTKQLTGKIPGIRELAREYSMNFKTANKAVAVLIDEGLLHRIQGKGTFVVDSATGLHGHHIVGFILPDLINPNFAHIVQALHQKEAEKNISILVSTTDRQLSRIEDILRMYRQRGISAIIVQGGSAPDTEALTRILDAKFPVIGMHTRIEGIDNVWLAAYAGAQMATDHLIEHFGLHVGHISGSAYGITNTRRFSGYRDAILSKGGNIDFSLLKSTEPSYAGGYKAVKELIAEDRLPRSLFMYNQIMVMGAINAIIGAGLSIPQDVALIGFDDSVDVAEMIVPTSTIDFSYSDTANQLLALVERRLNNPNSRPEQIRIAPRLIIRESSQPIDDVGSRILS